MSHGTPRLSLSSVQKTSCFPIGIRRSPNSSTQVGKSTHIRTHLPTAEALTTRPAFECHRTDDSRPKISWCHDIAHLKLPLKSNRFMIGQGIASVHLRMLRAQS